MTNRSKMILGVLLLAGAGAIFYVQLGSLRPRRPAVAAVSQVPPVRGPVTGEQVRRVFGEEFAARPLSLDVRPGQDVAETILQVVNSGPRPSFSIQMTGGGPARNPLKHDGTFGEGMAKLLTENRLVLWRDERGVVRIAEE